MRREERESLSVLEEFRSGFTWRSVLAILYSVLVFSPAVIWLSLVTLGVNLSGAVPFTTLLLFAEFARMTKKPLTKQEATIIFGPATVAGSAGFTQLIYKAWFVKQPLLNVFRVNPVEIPAWWAPPYTSRAYDLRTFIDPSMMMPLLITVVTWLLATSGALFFALFFREIYVEGERLSFPIQNITVEAIESLTEKRASRLDVLSWAGVSGLLYSIALYTIPTFTTALGYPIVVLPIPWKDLTPYIQLLLPGAALGIATDAMVFTQGFVLPAGVILGMLVGSVARFLVINPLLVMFGLTRWSEYWTSGMNLTQIFQYSNLYFWLNPTIGIGFAVGIVPILWRARTFAGSLKALFRRSSAAARERISGPPVPLYVMATLFVVGCVGALILDMYLAPGFPIWLLAVYELVLPFVIGLAATRMVGITGQAMNIPYLNQLIILGGVAQGYPRIDAWFLPLSLNPGTGWTKNLKLCQLTRTTIRSWVIVTLIAHPVGLLAGFFYTSLFWQLSPIPSALYPTPAIMWPIEAMNKLVWITRPIGLFDTQVILASFLIFGALISITNFIRLPFSMVSVAAGLLMPIPIPLTITIGLVTGRIIARALKKDDWFNEYKVTLAAGVGLGEGLAIVFGVMAALAVNSIWARPF